MDDNIATQTLELKCVECWYTWGLMVNATLYTIITLASTLKPLRKYFHIVDKNMSLTALQFFD